MLKDYVHISQGFQSSVNIAYDIMKNDKISDFIPTAASLGIIDNILSSAENDSAQRAKILTGAYGRGKSHMVLVALSLLSRKDCKHSFDKIISRMNEYDADLAQRAKNYLSSSKKLLPIIINGNSSNLSQSFLNALQQTLSSYDMLDIMPDTNYEAVLNKIKMWEAQYPDTYNNFISLLDKPINVFVSEIKRHNVEVYNKFVSIYPQLTAGSEFNPFLGFDLPELFEKVSIALSDKGYSGIYVVYDEFGKYLESSIASATESDTKMLQNFAEKCDRSTKAQMHLMLICHKDISNYIDMNLPKDMVDGWRGISARFEHLDLYGDYYQMYELMSAAIIKTDEWTRFRRRNQACFTDLTNTYKNLIENDDIKEKKKIIMGCYPLHPITAFILPRLSEQVAQNERTLFTFISSSQRNTLSSYVEKCDEDFSLMTPDYLFDYFESQFRKELSSSEVYSHYKLAATVLKKLDKNQLESKIIKIIALIYIINQFDLLPPTRENVVNALQYSYEATDIDKSISQLIDSKYVLYQKVTNSYLKIKDTYGTDVRELIKNRTEQVKTRMMASDILNNTTFDRYLYPAQYNDDNCITRYFDFVFISYNDFTNVERWPISNGSSGCVVGVLCDSAQEIEDLSPEQCPDTVNVVVVFPRKFEDISSFVYEYQAVVELRDEYVDDEFISDELDIFYDDLGEAVSNYIGHYTRPESKMSVYVYNNEIQNINRKSQVSSLLSSICRIMYPQLPIINNEVINKDTITSMAVNSRTKLINAILDDGPVVEMLGLTGTGQDVSFLRSTLMQTGILTENNGIWSLDVNTEDENIRQMLLEIQLFFSMATLSGEQSFQTLYNRLTTADGKMGLKKGVIPIYIAVVLRGLKDDIVIRFNGREVKLSADLLTSINENPQNYSVIFEDWDDDKLHYLAELEKLFSGTVVEQERRYNSFVYIANAISRWYISLPHCSKDMTKDYITNMPISKEEVRMANSLKCPIENARDFLMVTLPKLFDQPIGTSLVKKISSAKEVFDLGKRNLIEAIKIAIADKFGLQKGETIQSCLRNWVDHLEKTTIDNLFPNNENAIIALISSANGDVDSLVERLGKLLVGLRIDDWNNTNLDSFIDNLSDFKDMVDEFNSSDKSIEASGSKVKLIFVDQAGKEKTRLFEKTELSKRAALLFNDVSSAVEEMGDSITLQEKRQVLLEVLEKLC